MLDKDTSEERIAGLVDSVRSSPGQRDALVELLPEQHPIYVGRSANQTIRLRGYILAAFEQVGLPEPAVPYVLDELQNGRDAYLVAAAARALRGMQNPSGELVPFLLRAVGNIRWMDDAVTFEQYKPAWPLTWHTSALQEIFRSFRWLGVNARGALPELEALEREGAGFPEAIRGEIRGAIGAIRAAGEPARTQAFVPLSLVEPAPARAAPETQDIPAGLALEDQDGQRWTYAAFFHHKPSIVAFFYTRCTNPNKCSLTITKLARLQSMIREEGLEGGIRTAAITYDPGYDLPARLKAYGRHRGFEFGEDHRFFRALTGMHDVQEYFGLGVNFSGTIVNQHRIELFLLDPHGRVDQTFARLQWDPRDVLDSAKSLLPG